MTAIDEPMQRTNDSSSWRAGSLSDDEFERFALAIAPSWEVGLDAHGASDLTGPPPPAAIAAVPFSAPTEAVTAMLAGSSETAARTLPPPPPTTTASAQPSVASSKPPA